MTVTRRSCSAALLGIVLLTGIAHADAEEWRVMAGGSATITTSEVAGAEAEALGFGGRIRLGYGVTNNLELAIEAAGTRAQALAFPGAAIDRQEGTLFADATLAELSMGLRWTFGVEVWRALDRVRPFIGVRAGGLVQYLSGQVLLNEQDMILVSPEDDLRFRPFVGGSLGLERRFGDHFFAGISINLALGADYRQLGASLELAWAWY